MAPVLCCVSQNQDHNFRLVQDWEIALWRIPGLVAVDPRECLPSEVGAGQSFAIRIAQVLLHGRPFSMHCKWSMELIAQAGGVKGKQCPQEVRRRT